MHKLCPFCKLRNHPSAVECAHCGARFARGYGNHPVDIPDASAHTTASALPIYPIHQAGAWCGHCGFVLYVYSVLCPNCRNAVSAPPRNLPPPFDVASRFILARRLQVAAGFLGGLCVGLAIGSIGVVLDAVGQRSVAVETALAGWVAGLIVYRLTRAVDIEFSRGVGIGTLLGQIAFIMYGMPPGVDLSMLSG